MLHYNQDSESSVFKTQSFFFSFFFYLFSVLLLRCIQTYDGLWRLGHQLRTYGCQWHSPISEAKSDTPLVFHDSSGCSCNTTSQLLYKDGQYSAGSLPLFCVTVRFEHKLHMLIWHWGSYLCNWPASNSTLLFITLLAGVKAHVILERKFGNIHKYVFYLM